MAHLLILYTGGTIGMLPSAHGYQPATGYLGEALQRLHHAEALPEYTLLEYSPLIDSSALQPALWWRVASDIAHNYAAYDGFVVVHGTDTLAYSAAALSFLLGNLGKPVVVTGAMRPLCEANSDGEDNLRDACYWACQPLLHEVAVAFAGRLLRGNRVRKTDASSDAAFASPALPALGGNRRQPDLRRDLLLHSTLALQLRPLQVDLPIVAARLYPGYSIDFLAQALASQRPRGLVLECYGSGNAPPHHGLLAAVHDIVAGGGVVLNVSQCWHGRVDMKHYASGSGLLAAGALSGQNMTAEAALAKLYVLLSQAETPAAGICDNWAGELDALNADLI